MRSGKDQAVEYLKEFSAGSFLHDSFAGGVKEGCAEDFAPLAKLLNEVARNIVYYARVSAEKCSDKGLHDDLAAISDLAGSLALTNDNFFDDKTPLSRVLLQTYGTDIFRRRVDKDHWVKDFVDRVMARRRLNPVNYILCSDCRYPNEITTVRDLVDDDVKLVTVRIERPGISRSSAFNRHDSETALDKYHFDHVIYNDGTLTDFKAKVQALYEKMEGKKDV
jgi:hypothetical protein